jgi:hypothetical protein
MARSSTPQSRAPAGHLLASNPHLPRIADAHALTCDGLLRATVEAARVGGDTS